MAWLNESKNTRTILSVLPSSPRSENNISMQTLSNTEFNRPVHRVSGRVPTRKPDRSVRSKTGCPFRFRLAWWSKPGPPKYFVDLCENCTIKQGNKLGKLFRH